MTKTDNIQRNRIKNRQKITENMSSLDLKCTKNLAKQIEDANVQKMDQNGNQIGRNM